MWLIARADAALPIGSSVFCRCGIEQTARVTPAGLTLVVGKRGDASVVACLLETVCGMSHRDLQPTSARSRLCVVLGSEEIDWGENLR
jgi:hypothetical protein